MRNWPDIFGSPVEPDPVATAAATILPPPPPEPLNVKLRGLAIDDDGGWALLQMDGEIIRVRVGNAVGPNHVVKEIRSSGVLITGDGEVETLVFDD